MAQSPVFIFLIMSCHLISMSQSCLFAFEVSRRRVIVHVLEIKSVCKSSQILHHVPSSTVFFSPHVLVNSPSDCWIRDCDQGEAVVKRGSSHFFCEKSLWYSWLFVCFCLSFCAQLVQEIQNLREIVQHFSRLAHNPCSSRVVFM